MALCKIDFNTPALYKYLWSQNIEIHSKTYKHKIYIYTIRWTKSETREGNTVDYILIKKL